MHRIRTWLVILMLASVGIAINTAPAAASVDSYSIAPNYGGSSEIAISDFNLYWNGTIGRMPVYYRIPSAGGRMLQGNALYNWHRWPDHEAIVNYKNNGTIFLTANITASLIGYDLNFNRSPGVEDLIGFDVDLQWAFTYVNPDLANMTGTLELTPTSLKDNITLSAPSYGIFFPVTGNAITVIPDHLGFGDAGPGVYNHPIAGLSGMRLFTFTGGTTPPPPSGNNCTIYGEVVNLLTGNRIAGSTINLKDDSLPTGVYVPHLLPTGYGPFDINITDYYHWKGSAPGYNESISGSSFVTENCGNTAIQSQLVPSPLSTENATVIFFVHDANLDSGALVVGVPSAQVHISGSSNEYQITNDFGSASFTTPKTGIFNWTVTKDGFTGAEGTFTLAGDVSYNVDVALHHTGANPTLSIPEGDTSQDALQLVLNNAAAIVSFLLLLFFVGGLKLMAKK